MQKRGLRARRSLSMTARNVRRRAYYAQVRDGSRAKAPRRGRPSKHHTCPKKKRQSLRDMARYRAHSEIKNARKLLQNGKIQAGLESVVGLLQPTATGKVSKAVIKEFQPIHEALNQHRTLVEIGESSVNHMRRMGSYSSDARSMVRWLGTEVTDRKQLAEFINRPYSYVVSAFIPSFHPKQFDEARTRTSQRRRRYSHMLGDIVEDFFISRTHVLSGAKVNTRCLAQGFEKLKEDFYSVFPQLLRAYAQQHPQLLVRIQGSQKRTAFEENLLLAVKQEQVPGFDQEKEILTRKKEAAALYETALLKKRLREDGYTREDIQVYIDSTMSAEDLDDLETEVTSSEIIKIQVPSQRLFWGILNERKIRWTVNINPTECRIHDNGESWITELNSWHAEQSKLSIERIKLEHREGVLLKAGKPEPAELLSVQARLKELSTELLNVLSRIRKLRDNVALYRRHHKQYEICRPLVKALEEKLSVGEALIYRDFVAQYCFDGSKINNLVLVVLWRDTPDGQLQVFKLNHFCSVKDEFAHDSYYVAAVFDFYFRRNNGSDFFTVLQIKRIFISGDHGPHFTSKATVYNESFFLERYGVRVHCFFLCSYHAYNRCDSAGVESKQLSKQATKERKGFRDAGDFAAAVNGSKIENSFAYQFEKIRRDKVFMAWLSRRARTASGASTKMRRLQRCVRSVKSSTNI